MIGQEPDWHNILAIAGLSPKLFFNDLNVKRLYLSVVCI